MHGLDFSFTRREIAFALNFVLGILFCVGGFLGIYHFAPSHGAAGGNAVGALFAAAATALYITVWRVLEPFVARAELDAPDTRLFMRGVVAFLYGVGAAGLVLVGLRNL